MQLVGFAAETKDQRIMKCKDGQGFLWTTKRIDGGVRARKSEDKESLHMQPGEGLGKAEQGG